MTKKKTYTTKEMLELITKETDLSFDVAINLEHEKMLSLFNDVKAMCDLRSSINADVIMINILTKKNN